jgi:hypothetical protein
MEGGDEIPDDDDPWGGSEYLSETVEDIDPTKLMAVLRSLELLGEDPYLSSQVTNVGIVDNFLNELEQAALVEEFEDHPDRAQLFFLSAQTQMWIFALYELLRNWRQRGAEALKLAKNGGFDLKIAHLKKDMGFTHHARLARAASLERLKASPERLAQLQLDLRATYLAFRRLETIRISIAKHEESGRPNAPSYAPGYGRLDTFTGSLKYEISVGGAILDYVSRRDIADSIRAIDRINPQTDEELAEFDEFMKGAEMPRFDRPHGASEGGGEDDEEGDPAT